MADLRDQIIKAAKEGNDLEFIYEVSLGDEDKRKNFSKELIKIHNEGLIDVVAIFKKLKNEPNSNHDFFLTRHIFESILPELDSQVLEVMGCVNHLVKEAGQDLAAGALFEQFIEYCGVKADRPKTALHLIENTPELFADLLTPAIVAGSTSDTEYYLDEAIRLVEHHNIELRRRAIFSLGRINYSTEFNLISKAIKCFEKTIDKEHDDNLLGNLIKGVFNLFLQSEILKDKITSLISNALSKGDEYSIHAASELFFFNHKELPDDLMRVLFKYFLEINPANTQTLKNIDYGLAKSFKKAQAKEGIEFLESLLTTYSKDIAPKVFGSTLRELYKNENKILDKLLTMWLLKGKQPLCLFIREVVSLQAENDIILAVDKSSLIPHNFIQHIFLARKIVGYLFFKPLTAASLLVSLMENISDDETLEQLSLLLFEPLLINYPGKVMKFLKLKAEEVPSGQKKYIEDAILYYNDYLNGLKSTGQIVELHPSQTQRDEHMRHFSRIMSDSMKEAEKKSIWQSLCSKSVLLYGNKSINYVYGSGEKPKRMELSLQSHETKMEFPRLENIDPFGLDYMLRVFRVEQRKNEINH